MGDVAMTVPVLQVLTQSHPDLKITVVTRGFFKPMFNNLPNVHFHEADVYGKHKGGVGLWRLATELKALNIDAVADLHNVIRSNVITSFLWLKGVPSNKIDKGRREKTQLTQADGKEIRPLKSTHERYADVFRKLGFAIDLDTWIKPRPEPLTERSLELMGSSNFKKIGIAPFAAFSSKMYPLENIEALVTRLNSQQEYDFFLFGGGKKEAEQLETLARPFKNVRNLTGKMSFEEELACISHLDAMVSMDSGNGHLAALFGIPVITLWGVTHPYAGFVPFNQPMKNQLMADRKKFPLIPTSIYGNKFPQGYEKAIDSISPDTIAGRIMEVLS